MANVLSVIEWLTGDECHEADDAGLVAGLGRRLRAIGLPVDRMVLYLRTLHPEIFGRSIAWSPGEPVEIHDRDHGIQTAAALAGSPLPRVMATRETAIVRLTGADRPAWTTMDIFRGRNLVEYVFVALSNADGPVSAASFSTARRGGFRPEEREMLARIVPALRNACELRTLRRVELTLLDTYIGATTARRILAGRIRRGEVESLPAALMLCDLRGFTAMSNALPSARVLELLNTYFDLVLPAIAAAGGEVVKFMGDAVLAFFHRDDPAAACAAALQGARDALTRLDGFSADDAVLRTGIALHYGDVAYGNIGSGHRLDFTVIGPDVNLVSRIQGLCGPSGEALLMSERFAGLIGRAQTRPVGRHELRGFAEATPLHALAMPLDQLDQPGAIR